MFTSSENIIYKYILHHWGIISILWKKTFSYISRIQWGEREKWFHITMPWQNHCFKPFGAWLTRIMDKINGNIWREEKNTMWSFYFSVVIKHEIPYFRTSCFIVPIGLRYYLERGDYYLNRHFHIMLNNRVSRVEQELITLPEHRSSTPPSFSVGFVLLDLYFSV